MPDTATATPARIDRAAAACAAFPETPSPAAESVQSRVVRLAAEGYGSRGQSSVADVLTQAANAHDAMRLSLGALLALLHNEFLSADLGPDLSERVERSTEFECAVAALIQASGER